MNYPKTVVLLLFISSIFSLNTSAAIIEFSASGTMNTIAFDPAFFSAPENGTPWSVLVRTNSLLPDLDPDPNVGSYYALDGTMTIGSYQFNMTQFPIPTRLFNVFNSTGGTTTKDRATLQVFSNTSSPTLPSIGPNAIANFAVAMESPDDQLVVDDSLTGLIGLTVEDLCGSSPCSTQFGSRFAIQLYQPSVTGLFELRGNLEFLSITVVPIPAAAWLFGSALGLLGWMWRKTT